MIIIIDGYNLLKQLHPNNKENLEFHKKVLLKKLGAYKKIKLATIKDIIIVYDGGGSIHAMREVHYGVVTLSTGYKNSADDWIIDYVDRHKNQEITLVSMDRALCRTCEQHGAFSIGVFDFAKALDQVIQDTQLNVQEEMIGTQSTHKFQTVNFETTVEFPKQPTNLDDLMHDGAHMRTPNKLDTIDENKTKKSNSLSRQEKVIVKKIKKIY